MNYADRIAMLVETQLTQNDGSAARKDLLRALGCRCVTWITFAPSTPEPGNEILIRETLLHALRHLCAYEYPQREDAVAILDGLWQNQRWLDCLNNPEDTYCLAALCILTVVDNLFGGLRSLPNPTQAQLCGVLNTWITPADAFMEHPSTEIMARALFGDPWYEICVKQASIHRSELATFIYRTRPSFLSATLESSAMALPPLDMP